MKIYKLLFASMLAVLFMAPAAAQYDVLPEDGRNELFHDFLLNEVEDIIAERAVAIEAALATEETVKARQQEIRSKYLELLGDFPEKTDLNAEVVGTIDTITGYSIEKLHYQSRPNHHVTANFYIPEGDGPHPAVLFMCGHYPLAKTWTEYQRLSALFAKHGIACLIVDPISQYERYQITDASGSLTEVGQSGTSAHSQLDQGLVNCGTSVVAFELWDNHRGLDYLYSRLDVVDTSKIGALGHSGGGSQVTNMLAFDQRLKAGCVTNFMANETAIFTITGPQTASQNLSYEGAMGIDQPDYVELFAPKPYMMIGTDDGLFPLAATRETYEEAKMFYDKLGAPDAINLFATEGADHNYIQVKREATVRWFKRWFLDTNDTIVEGYATVFSAADLNVTPTANVMTHFDNEVNVTDINVALADGYASARTDFWANNTKDSCLNMVKSLIRSNDLDEAPVYQAVETIDRDYYTVEKAKITCKDDVPVTSLLFKANDAEGRLPVMLYVDGRGKATDAEENAILEKAYLDKGYLVMAIDVRGFGETADSPGKNEAKHNNKEHRNAVISAYTGKTLPGQRVEDIEKVLEVLLSRDDVDVDDITIYGLDRAAVAVLHAAALDERINKVILSQTVETPWLNVVSDPSITGQMTNEVPSALKYYSIPDLVNAIAPREVVYDNTYDSRLSKISVSYGELDKTFSSEIFDYEVINTTRDYVRINATAYNTAIGPEITGTGTYDLPAQDSVIQVTVTTPDGESETVYNITLPEYVGVDNALADAGNLLSQNFPNPVTGTSTISYTVNAKSTVSLEVVGTDGRVVKNYIMSEQAPGDYSLEINAAEFSSGMYMYNLYFNDRKVAARKMVIGE